MISTKYLNTKQILSSKTNNYRPPDMLDKIKLLSFTKKENAVVFGSANLRIQKYPADIDLKEHFIKKNTKEAVIKSFKTKLVNKVKKINKTKGVYFSEYKCGIDKRYDIYIGTLKKGVYEPTVGLDKLVEDYHENGLFDDREYNILTACLAVKKYTDFPLAEDLDQMIHDMIFYVIRNRRILRWSTKEIISGKKKVPKGEISLSEALTHDAHVKLDIVTFINGRAIEITNFLFLGYIDKNNNSVLLADNFMSNKELQSNLYNNQINPINAPEEIDIIQLKIDIERLLYSNFYFNPFKGLKRMFSLLLAYKRFQGTSGLRDNAHLIGQLIGGDLSYLYKLKSEVQTLISIVDNSKNAPIKEIKKNLSMIAYDLENISILDKRTVVDTQDYIMKIMRYRKKSNLIEKLEVLEKVINELLGVRTIYFMEESGLKHLPPLFTGPDMYRHKLRFRKRTDKKEIFDIIVANLTDILDRTTSKTKVLEYIDMLEDDLAIVPYVKEEIMAAEEQVMEADNEEAYIVVLDDLADNLGTVLELNYDPENEDDYSGLEKNLIVNKDIELKEGTEMQPIPEVKPYVPPSRRAQRIPQPALALMKRAGKLFIKKLDISINLTNNPVLKANRDYIISEGEKAIKDLYDEQKMKLADNLPMKVEEMLKTIITEVLKTQ